ncbi:hypothetical protein [Curtobacterium sp. PhB115]|uniref:hypothetical protein n=1 Tax=Curtobacterium sp. PhB115 TaxID=2485173 RepID=UPI0011CE1B90|nr:hypothetical protein [Curtobacterium sp. PhB115]
MRLPSTVMTPGGLSVRGAGPELLAELLLEVDAVCLRDGYDLQETMAPGVTREVIDAAWAPRGIAVPEEAIVWWGWHNGARPDLGRYAGVRQVSVAFSAESWDLKTKGTSAYTWNRSWIPVWGPGPDHIAIDTRDHRDVSVRATEFDLNTQETADTPGVISLCTPITWWLTARAEGWVAPGPVADVWKTELIPTAWLATELARL